MTDETRARLRVLIAQADAIEELASTLGMQAATLKRGAQAILAGEPLPPPSAMPGRTGPGPVAHFNVPKEDAILKA
jgi:hypothetical protein